jgi:hypothetical protein
MKLALIFSLILCLNISVFAADKEKGAAKIIVLKGKVTALIGKKAKPLKKGDWLPVGAQVKTQERSFAKLLFIDKSTMNVGPSSQMKIDAFPKEDAGIITLVKGQIRSKVTKNYMDMKKKDKSKLFIKTKTAAMGVRGTDFQVSYSRKTRNTTLVTFEGAVAMAKLGAMGSRFNQAALERVVSSPQAVMVRRGQFSGASANAEKTTPPVKISPVQLETLESKPAPGLKVEDSQSSIIAPKKKFRKVVPPGVDAQTVANDGSELTKSMAGVVAVKKPAPAAKSNESSSAPEAGPKAGTIVHMETGLFVSPPEDAAFDANTQTYDIPKDVAFVDPKSGELTSPNFEISSGGKWEKKAAPAVDQRSPASVSTTGSNESGPSEDPTSATEPAGPPALGDASKPTLPPQDIGDFSQTGSEPIIRPELCLPPNCFQPPDVIPGRPVNLSNGKTKVIFNPVIQ